MVVDTSIIRAEAAGEIAEGCEAFSMATPACQHVDARR